MRRPLQTRATAVIATGALMLILAGGYALATSTTKVIHACVSKHSGDLYVGKCAKGDKKLSWNTVGPRGAQGAPGPGASEIVYNAAATAAAKTVSIGKIGPYSLSANCLLASGGNTTLNVYESGPAGQLDALAIISGPPVPVSGAFPAFSHVLLLSPSPSSAGGTTTAEIQVITTPVTGQATESFDTEAADGTTHTCHFSAAITPLSVQHASADVASEIERGRARRPSAGQLAILGIPASRR